MSNPRGPQRPTRPSPRASQPSGSSAPSARARAAAGRPGSARRSNGATVTQLRSGQNATAKAAVKKVQDRTRWYYSLFRGQSDEFYWVLGITLVILVGGLIMVMSSGAIVGLRDNNNAYYYFWKQLFFTAIGLILLGVASSVPVNGYWKVANLAFVVSFITEFIPFIPGIGKSVNGNTAWINLGFFTIQPSEFMKLFMIIFIAKLMAENEGRETARVPFSTIEVLPMWLYFAVAILAIIPVIGGKDMGTAMVMLFIVLLLGYLQNLPSFEFRMPLVVTVLGIAGGLLLGTNRIARIQAWLFPDSPAGAIYSWQSQHGLWALAGGGLFGAGLGNSKLKWSWIPEVQNDYIFAVIGEELGMLGALLTIGLFVLLSVHLFRIYQRCDTLFARSITMGVALWITLQAFINIAVVLTMLPVLGVPLPLVSYGGSSVISGIVAIGVVLSFERDNHKRLGPRR